METLKQDQTSALQRLNKKRQALIGLMMENKDLKEVERELQTFKDTVKEYDDAHEKYSEALAGDETEQNKQLELFEKRIASALAFSEHVSQWVAARQPVESKPANQPEGSTSVKITGQSATMSPPSPLAPPFFPQSAVPKLAEALYLPAPEIDKFSGDVTTYQSFINAFEARIATRIGSNSDRLYYLEQHLQGEPRDLVSSCCYLPAEEGYRKARQVLHNEYGDPYKVSMAYLTKIHDWNPLKQDDCVGLKQLSLFLVKCQCAMKALEYMQALDFPQSLQSIIQKLPPYLVNQWRERVGKIRNNESRVPTFNDVVLFVSSAADTANDPVYGKSALNPAGAQRARSSSFNTAIKPAPMKGRTCVMCHGPHHLLNCTDFYLMELADKRLYLRDNRLCFSCFNPGHISKFCQNKQKCEKCDRMHATVLHDDSFYSRNTVDNGSNTQSSGVEAPTLDHSPPSQERCDERTEAKSVLNASACMDSTTILHAVLPVRVHLKGRSQSICTYAFFDNGSSGCFISNELRLQLDIPSTDTMLQLRTMSGTSTLPSKYTDDLLVSDLHGNNTISLPRTYSKDEIPMFRDQIPTRESLSQHKCFSAIASLAPPSFPDLEVGLMIGNSCPAAMEPLEVIPSNGQGPYAVRLRHGWTIHGPLAVEVKHDHVSVNRVHVQEVESIKEIPVPSAVSKMFEREFEDNTNFPDQRGSSYEDHKFMTIMDTGTTFSDGHYTCPLPFRNENVLFPDNRALAWKRAMFQKSKMLKNETYRKDYVEFVETMISHGYASEIGPEQRNHEPGKVWYLPHHGIYNPNKPGKIRVVFDCSASYANASLNGELLQGPDLTNSLLGVLIRFREEKTAFTGDIEKMFYQVRIPASQRSFVRFIWWPNGNLEAPPCEFQMNVHLFGAISSPSVVNYALRRTATEAQCCNLTQDTILHNFYVDDCLKSVPGSELAGELIDELSATLLSKGFHLTKFTSNDAKVIDQVPISERAKEVTSLDLSFEDLPATRTLGIQWNMATDCFGFLIDCSSSPQPTRRGVLSLISSLYDPLGLLAPVVLNGKQILRDICNEHTLGWDDVIPPCSLSDWEKWISELPVLASVNVPRGFQPPNCQKVVSKELHIFSDASQKAYGAVVYLRLTDSEGNVFVQFVIGKSRLTPNRHVTIPKLELTAALTSVKLAHLAKRELREDLDITYHCDSTAVLGYIANDKRRWEVYVANRVEQIRKFSSPSQWRYVNTHDNPADLASRGLRANQLRDSVWITGPAFLSTDKDQWPTPLPDQCKHQSVMSAAAVSSEAEASAMSPTDYLTSYFSSWKKLRSAVATFHKFISFLKAKAAGKQPECHPISVSDYESAETAVFRYLQRQRFPDEACKNTATRRKKRGPLYRLDPFLDQADVLRVGGRMKRSHLCFDAKHPIILPKSSQLTRNIIYDTHVALGHAGRHHVLAALRDKFWIIHGNSEVRHVLSQCVGCKRLRGPCQEQKMADLPSCRTEPGAPFTYSAVDYFGPFEVKDRRSVLKRYGVIFTCLTSRAVHLEVSWSLDTDSCINAIRRFVSRRGQVKVLYSDNGTNFVSANRELASALSDLDPEKIACTLRDQMNIDWHFNPPSASHMGGVWERNIRTVRKILSGLLLEHGQALDTESLCTLLCEVEAIINTRPLSTVSSDAMDPEPLTPAHILTGKSTWFGVSNPGVFQKADMFLKKRWRRVQHLADVFWSRWRREYLSLLNQRQKWTTKQANINDGDVVLIADDQLHRNDWPLGVVTDVKISSDDCVRSVTLRSRDKLIRRPIHKLVLLVASDHDLVNEQI